MFCHSMRLFHPTVWWKYSLFLRFSPWRDPRPRYFSGYPFGGSRKKASTIFYDTAFSFIFPLTALRLGHFIGYSLGIFEKQGISHFPRHSLLNFPMNNQRQTSMAEPPRKRRIRLHHCFRDTLKKGIRGKGVWGRAAGSDCSFIPWSPQKIPDKRPQA